MPQDDIDRAGLIRESYRIEGITAEECRSIFVDWALQLPATVVPAQAIAPLLDRHGADDSHPMTAVLRAGLEPAAAPARRGGRSARRP